MSKPLHLWTDKPVLKTGESITTLPQPFEYFALHFEMPVDEIKKKGALEKLLEKADLRVAQHVPKPPATDTGYDPETKQHQTMPLPDMLPARAKYNSLRIENGEKKAQLYVNCEIRHAYTRFC